jgi:hypothetical protein
LPVEYRSWLSSPTHANKACTYTAFAFVTREHLTRLRINGVEQLMDWSWSWEVTIPTGMRGESLTIEYLDARSGKVVATHELSESCYARGEK